MLSLCRSELLLASSNSQQEPPTVAIDQAGAMPHEHRTGAAEWIALLFVI